MVKGRLQILHSAPMGLVSKSPTPYQGGKKHTMIFFQHLHVRVVRQAVLAHAGKVGALPARAVEVLFYLGRHCGSYRGDLAFRDIEKYLHF